VVSFTPLRLYPREKSLLLSIRGWVGPTDDLDGMEKCTFFTLSGFEFRRLSRPTSQSL
jgi:hypothetical protein